MKLDREIVDRFLAGQEIADSWIFSQIEEGKHCFDLSDAVGKEGEIREITRRVSNFVNNFVPENEEVYRQLFPDYPTQLQQVQVCLTVGCPNPYDAMVRQREEGGVKQEVIVFDMVRFLAYGERALELISRLVTHETAHILMHKRWPVLAQEVPYRRQLQSFCFDEGFAHLLACGEKIASFDFGGWVAQHWEPSLQKLREALACTDPQEQQEWLCRAVAGSYWEKFACIAGKLYLAQHRDQLSAIYSQGPDRFLPEIFSPAERKA